MLRRTARKGLVGASAVIAVLALAVVASADNVTNDVESSTGVGNMRTVTLGESTSVSYKIVATGNSCDAADGSAATLTISAPAAAGASPTSLTFTQCEVGQAVTFTPTAVGTYDITNSVSDARGSYNESPANFKLRVVAPTIPANGAPAVSSAAADADGNEGDTLTASGSFSDPDGDPLTLEADNAVGTFTDNGDGSWSWTYATTDDDAGGTVTVTASDGKGGNAVDDFAYSAANVAPELSALTLGGSNCSPSLGFSFSDPGSADTHSGSVNWGDGSTPDAFTTSPFSGSHGYTSAGTYEIGVQVADDDGGSDSDSSLSHTVKNVPGNILQPINYTGPRSAFKLGSTIPVKIVVKDCGGNVVGTLAPQVSVIKLDGTPDGQEAESVSTATPTSGTTMRYDAAAGQYIYNLATKQLSTGDFRITISDGSFPSSVSAVVSLKK